MGVGNNISLLEPLLAEIRGAAHAERRSVDEVLSRAVRRYVEERSWTKLLDYGTEQVKPNPGLSSAVNDPSQSVSSGNKRIDISDAIVAGTNRVLRDKFQWDRYMLQDAPENLRARALIYRSADSAVRAGAR